MKKLANKKKVKTLTIDKKIDILNHIIKSPNDTNRYVAQINQVSASQVSSIRFWFEKKGLSWLIELKKELKTITEQKKINEKLFKNFNGKEKHKARQIIVNVIKSGGMKRGSVLTLPCSEWEVEKLIQKNYTKSFNYVACERNSGTMIKMVQKINQYGKNNTIHHGELSEKIFSAKQDQYAHIIADYCGTLTKVKNEIVHACMNNVVKVNGTITITLLKARTNNDLVSDLNFLKQELTKKEVRQNDNESAIKMFFKTLSAMTDFEIIEEFCYTDTSPMILIALKRVR